MPTVAVVDGVKIRFYPNDHPPPDFHAEVGGHRASIHIQTLKVLRGSLPENKRRAVVEWASERKDLLTETFVRAIEKLPLEPLR